MKNIEQLKAELPPYKPCASLSDNMEWTELLGEHGSNPSLDTATKLSLFAQLHAEHTTKAAGAPTLLASIIEKGSEEHIFKWVRRGGYLLLALIILLAIRVKYRSEQYNFTPAPATAAQDILSMSKVLNSVPQSIEAKARSRPSLLMMPDYVMAAEFTTRACDAMYKAQAQGGGVIPQATDDACLLANSILVKAYQSSER